MPLSRAVAELYISLVPIVSPLPPFRMKNGSLTLDSFSTYRESFDEFDLHDAMPSFAALFVVWLSLERIVPPLPPLTH